MLRQENSVNSTMEEKANVANCSVNELPNTHTNMPNSNPNPNSDRGVSTDNITNLATASKQAKVADIQDNVTTSSSDEKMKEAPQSPTCEKNKFDKRVAFRSNHSSRTNFGKRGKAGYEIVLSQIPKHADLKIVKGAIRARIGKFKCVRCEMYRHGMCKIWVRKPDTRDKILNNAIYIFGVQIKAGLEPEAGAVLEEEAEAEQLADVYLSNIPPSCTVKKLMGMVKQIVGDFVACNRVVIEKGTSKITFKYSKHQRTLLKNGFGGELANVVIQSTPSSPKAGDHPVKKNSFAGTSMVRTEEVPEKRVIDSMSCSDTSNSAGGSWHQQLSNMSISNDSDSGMSTWSEMVTAASSMRKSDAQNVNSLATAQYEAAAEMLYAQQQQRRNTNSRRRRGSRHGNNKLGRGSALSANYLMLENEKLRMEIELMRMQSQYTHGATEDSYGMRGYNGYEPTSLKNAYAEADPRVDVERHLDDYCALPEFTHGSIRQSSDAPWMMHKYRGSSW